jgi:oxygen-dependent protoporphyrinogen oxidase
MTYDLVIVGGGIAGLSAAWYAQEAGLDYALVEASGRWGGKIETEMVNTEYGPVLVEHGPDSFISQKPWAAALSREVGMGEALLGTNDAKRRTYVLNRGRLKNLPDGMMLIVPTRFLPFATSGLISPLGKLRMGLEALIPARKDDGDESLADFVRRRLGPEALDKLAEPLMSGIYNTDAEHQSLMATFPRFRTLEQKHGSLTQGMLAAQRARAGGHHGTNGKKSSLFTSLDAGMESMVAGVVRALEGDLRLNTPVCSIRKVNDEYFVLMVDGEHIAARQVLLTTPAYVASSLLTAMAPDAAALLADIQYVDTGTVSLAYRKRDIPRPLDGFGLVVPRSEKRDINAITVSSTKFDCRAPEEIVLFRLFFGGARTPHVYAMDDDAVIETVTRELYDVTCVTAEPLVTRLVRTPQGTPQYDVGHLERMANIEAALPAGLHLAGSAYRGVGVPDCVRQGKEVVEGLVN